MKALTVKNPWAGTILLLGKDVENRTRKTNYRGRVLIHSSRMQDMGAYHGAFGKMFSNPDFRDKLCFGCIIGSVELFDCIPNAESKWAEPGLWHWRVRDPIVFEDPIAVKGNLGIWEYNGKLPDEMKKSE
jgi:hypothetical protein